MFIAFEGGEAAGKSTQETLLAASLVQAGRAVVRTREPGGTPAGEAIREIVLSPAYEGLDPHAEALLFAAARGEHVARIIRPALQRGAVVVCDRYIDSSIAYQGAARGLGIERVRELSLWATDGLLPDLTLVLDIDPVIGLSRVTSPDRLESESVTYHRQVRQAFLDLAAAEPNRYLVLDASATQQEIAGQIWQRVADELDAR
ncbi:MAG: dTMP kinase [Actinomycetales bacterium]|nr:dTMP kinase [Actinomycetales bacterium]